MPVGVGVRVSVGVGVCVDVAAAVGGASVGAVVAARLGISVGFSFGLQPMSITKASQTMSHFQVLKFSSFLRILFFSDGLC